MRLGSVLPSIVLLIMSSTVATAVTVVGDIGDGLVDVNGEALNLTDPTIRPGTGGGSATSFVRGQAGVFFFQLPNLVPMSTITEAQLSLGFLGIEGSPDFDVDLFGLGTRLSATILPSDYFAGPPGVTTDRLLLEKLATPATTAGTRTVDVTGYLQTLYSPSGVPDNGFLVVRVSPNTPLATPNNPIRGYLFATANNGNADFRPTLAIQSVPEPSGMSIWVLLAVAAIINRLGVFCDLRD